MFVVFTNKLLIVIFFLNQSIFFYTKFCQAILTCICLGLQKRRYKLVGEVILAFFSSGRHVSHNRAVFHATAFESSGNVYVFNN